MDEFIERVKEAVRMLGAVLSLVTDWLPGSVQLLLLLMTVDLLTGAVLARINKTWRRQRFVLGMFVKAGILFLVWFGYLAEYQLRAPVALTIAGWFVGYETVSVVGNLKQLGVPIPPVVFRVAEQFKKMFGKGDGGKSNGEG